MFVPPIFNEDRVPVIHDAIRKIGFGTLVTLTPDGMEASHVPMLLRPEPEPYGTLIGHLSRANPQWTRVAPGTRTLAIFLGPEGYVTPSWYATKKKTGKVVPTWNYVAVHAYGTIEFRDDAAGLREIVTALTDTHESPRAQPWAVTDAPEDFIQAQLKGIVGFALKIERLEGKWKMSQNRPAEDRAGVIDGLRAEGGDKGARIADEIPT